MALLNACQRLVGMSREIRRDGHRPLREASIPKLGASQFPQDPQIIVHWEDRVLDGRSSHGYLIRGPDEKSFNFFRNIPK